MRRRSPGWLDIRQQTVAKPKYDELEQRYAIQPDSRLEAENAAFDEPGANNAG